MIPHYEERVTYVSKQRDAFIAHAKKHGTPSYVFDESQTQRTFRRFRDAFISAGVTPHVFFAIKSNPSAPMLRTVVREGGFLDASSPRELALALAAEPSRIVYTGPGKTVSAFEKIFAHKNDSEITVNLDSFHELNLLGSLTDKCGIDIRCGIRVSFAAHGAWQKFGIPAGELPAFFAAAKKFRHIRLCGIHFHTTYNYEPARYTKAIRALKKILREGLSEADRNDLEFLDIGGGFPSPSFEGSYPWNPQFRMLYDHHKEVEKILKDAFHPRFIPELVVPIETYATEIAQCFLKELKPLAPQIELYMEPGQWLSHNSIHILLSIADIKAGNIAILDGGMNMIGFEKYQYLCYVPTFNLTHFSTAKEVPFLLYGSLCTPNDIWGYYIFAEQMKVGDVVILPFQGDYTITYAQGNFIQQLPEVISLGEH